MVLMKFGRDSSMRSLVDSLASKIHANFGFESLVLLRVSPCILFLRVLQGIAGVIGVQFLASIPDGFFEFLILRVNEINS